MDPNLDRTNGYTLPMPVETGNAPAQAAGESRASFPEIASGVPQPGPMPQPSLTTPVSPQLPLPNQNQSVTAVASNTTAIAIDTPQAADDADLIEKEWVHKAKVIVEKTRDDPHMQSDELTKFKADYMQKRYNKTLKMSE
jgi:hypothetical protein